MEGSSQYQQPGFLHRAVLVFVLATCVRLWIGPVSLLEEARAQIPDAAKQRKLVLEEARATNVILREIRELLRTQTFNVRVEGADKKAPTPDIPRSGR